MREILLRFLCFLIYLLLNLEYIWIFSSKGSFTLKIKNTLYLTKINWKLFASYREYGQLKSCWYFSLAFSDSINIIFFRSFVIHHPWLYDTLLTLIFIRFTLSTNFYWFLHSYKSSFILKLSPRIQLDQLVLII